MKVDIVSQANQSAGLRLSSNSCKPNFTGAAGAAAGKELPGWLKSKLVTREITKGLPQAGAINIMKKFEGLKGELGGILITAFGTGAVAPIFIAFNPFAKAPKNATPEEKQKNKDTKAYTAWRQPVSAVLAVLCQASVQKYIDRFIDIFVNDPKYSKYQRFDEDHSILNTDTYLKNKVKDDLKKENVKKPSIIASFFGQKEDYYGQKLRARSLYNEKLKDRVEAQKDEQLKQLAKMIRENAEKSDVDGLIPRSGGYWDSKDAAAVVNDLIDSYKKDAKSLIKTPEEVANKVERAEVLIENENYLRDLFKDIPGVGTAQKPSTLTEIKEKAADTTKAVQEAIKKVEQDSHLSQKQKGQIKVLLDEILKRPEDLRARRIERTLWRIDNIKATCAGKEGGFSHKNYLEAMNERNTVLANMRSELECLKIKDPQKATKQEIVDTINKVAEQCRIKVKGGVTDSVLKDTNTFGYDGGKLLNKVYKDIAKGCKKVMKNSHTGWSQFMKIFVGIFITLPITCTALNWVYPRFMEIFFPRLAGVKNSRQSQKTGGDK